ncbi:MAG: methylated-DNA--[protein]-cysteine S-methyltransferase [Oscillospiraceae bacterium]|nr:methylated-DNA--[protein]-cysteine S-methyltransferase [Oscillospiraceae bacterium]
MDGGYIFESPIGMLEIREKNGYISGISLCGGADNARHVCRSDLLYEAHKQLGEYFCGTRKIFDLPLSCEGTPFRQAVWKELHNIPYGETRSYADIAAAIGKPSSVRAVGQANAANPLLIIIPCHRVIRKSGADGGYVCGAEAKRLLLELEKRYSAC